MHSTLSLNGRKHKLRVPIAYMTYFPAPVSNWQVAHFGQQLTLGRFTTYAYGIFGNIANYGFLFNPDFPLKNIPKNQRLVIMYGITDSLITKLNTKKFTQRMQSWSFTNVIPHLVTNGETPFPTWSHFDFVTGLSANRLIYSETVAYLDAYTVWDGPV